MMSSLPIALHIANIFQPGFDRPGLTVIAFLLVKLQLYVGGGIQLKKTKKSGLDRVKECLTLMSQYLSQYSMNLWKWSYFCLLLFSSQWNQNLQHRSDHAVLDWQLLPLYQKLNFISIC